MKLGELYKLRKKSNKFYSDHADSFNSFEGKLQIRSNEELLSYGLDKFSFINKLDIYVIPIRENGHTGNLFGYQCYAFNELGEAIHIFGTNELELL